MTASLPSRETVPEIEPGREEEFRYLQRWLAASAALDRLIEAAEPPGPPQPATAPAETLAQTAGAPRGLRARFAAGLAALAVALHPEAAAGALHQLNEPR